MGVTSLIDLTSKPTVCSARIADSRPDPGPLTRTSTVFIPCSRALVPAVTEACCAANGVPFREPLNPMDPALDQQTRLPCLSVMLMIVLLKVAWTKTRPVKTTFFPFSERPFCVLSWTWSESWPSQPLQWDHDPVLKSWMSLSSCLSQLLCEAPCRCDHWCASVVPLLEATFDV